MKLYTLLSKKVILILCLGLFCVIHSQVRSKPGSNLPWTDPTTWVDGVVPNATDPVEIPSGSSVVSNSVITRDNTTTIFGTLINNSTFIIRSGVHGAIGSQFVIASGGICEIQAGGFFDSFSPTYNSGSTLKYNTGGVYNRNIEWGWGTDIPHHIIVTGNTILNPGVNSGKFNTLKVNGNLTIDAGSSIYMDYGSDDMEAPIDVLGNVTVFGNLSLSSMIGGDLKVKGNLIFESTSNFYPNARAVFFTNNNVSTPQIIENKKSTVTLDIPYVVFEPKVAGSNGIQINSNITVKAPNGGAAIKFNNANDRFYINNKTLTIGSTGVSNYISGNGFFYADTNVVTNTSDLILLGNVADLQNGQRTVLKLPSLHYLRNLTINKESGKISCELASQLNIKTGGSINLLNGILDANKFTIQLLNNAVITQNTSNPSGNFIIADDLGGKIRKYFIANKVDLNFTFPVGDRNTPENGLNYSPITVNISKALTTLSGNGGYLQVQVFDTSPAENDAETNLISRYWHLLQSGFINPKYSASAFYLDEDIIGDESTFKNSVYDVPNTEWTQQGNTNGGSNQISFNNMANLALAGHYITAGEKVKKREINVRGNGLNIESGDLSPDLYDNTDFGTTLIGNDIVKEFVVENVGDKMLNIASIKIMNEAGTALSTDFTIISPLNTALSLPELAQQTLQIRFNAVGALGLRKAKIVIDNNDSNEFDYNFIIQANLDNKVPCGKFQILAVQNFETSPALPTYGYTVQELIPDAFHIVAGGKAFANAQVQNKFINRQSLQVFNAKSSVEMNSIDTSTKQDPTLYFNLAAFGFSSGKGLLSGDYAEISVSNDGGTTWYKQIRINGTGNSNWWFNVDAPNNYVKVYNTTNVPTVIGLSAGFNTNANIRYEISGMPKVTQLKIKIELYSQSDYNIWALDDIILIDNQANKSWNGSVWEGVDNSPPKIFEKAVIKENYNTTSGNITACDCEVRPNKSLTISPNTFVEIQNNIVNNGAITIESDGNLIQRNNAGTYTGNNLTVKRKANFYSANDYNYWGSPVKDRNLYGFSPNSPATDVFWYNEADDYFYTTGLNSASKFEFAKGYAIIAPQQPETLAATSASPYVWEGNFVGIPNNGIGTFTLKMSDVEGGYNLISNPYPSNLDFDKLFSDNSNDIYQSAWYWTNSTYTPNQQGSNYGNYGVNNYAIYNGTGGVSATTFPSSPPVSTPNKDIKVSQGFIVKAKSNNAALDFNNAQRNASNSSIFFNKMAGSSKDRFWIELISPVGIKNEILVGYVENAGNVFELDFDSQLLTVGSDAVYTILGGEKLGIQGRKYPLDSNDVVFLGTNHYQPGNYTLKLKQKEGIFAVGQAIYLKDKLTGTITNLLEESYQFAAQKGAYDNRFEIVYKDVSPSVVPDNTENNALIVYRNGENYVIKSDQKNIINVEVYNGYGILIMNNRYPGNNKEVTLNASSLLPGMYVLKIKTASETYTRKILK